MQRRQCHRRRSIATLRFKNQCAGMHIQLAQLLGHHEAVLLIAHYQGRGRFQGGGATEGFLQHGNLTHQWQKLLGVGLSGNGPQPAADASGKKNWC